VPFTVAFVNNLIQCLFITKCVAVGAGRCMSLVTADFGDERCVMPYLIRDGITNRQ